MAQTTYQKIEEYIDLMVSKGYSPDYILEQLETKKENLRNNFNDLSNKINNNATGNLTTPTYLLSDFLKERRHPKPAYLSDMSIHPAVRRYFEALYNIVDDYELYFAPPCNPDEFTAIEKYFEITLPKAFKDFYLITNGGGEKINVDGKEIIPAFYCYYPLSLKYIIENSKEEAKWYIADSPYMKEMGFEYEVYLNSSNPMIFAFDNSGNGLWFDSNEIFENGIEIVETGADFFERVPITKSFEELLNNVSKSMEKVENITIDYKNDPSYPYHLEWQIDLYEVLRSEPF